MISLLNKFGSIGNTVFGPIIIIFVLTSSNTDVCVQLQCFKSRKMAAKSIFLPKDMLKMDLSALTENRNQTLKNLVPAMCEIFRSFQFNLNSILESMQKDFVKILEEQDREIKLVKTEISDMKKQIMTLEEKIEDNEAYERRDSLILSGNALPDGSTNENCLEVVQKLLTEHLSYVIQPTDISVVHRLGKKPISQKPDRRNIIIKFCRRNSKVDLLAAARRVKPSNLFLNESLTPQRQNISYALRKAKREFPHIVSGTSTSDGRVYVWVKPPNPDAPGAKDSREPVNTYSKLEIFCERFLEKKMDYFLSKQ